jgi:hypothetical protein
MSAEYSHGYVPSLTPTPLQACCYAFSVTLFFIVVIERVGNAAATLFYRLVWGGGSLSGDAFGTILAHIKDRYNIREHEFYDSPHIYHALEVYSSPSNGAGSTSSVKGYASMQMVGSGVTFFATIIASIADGVVSAATALSVYAVWAFFTTLVFSLLYVLQENYSDVLIDAVDQYDSTYGPFIHKIIFIPLQVQHTCMCFSI